MDRLGHSKLSSVSIDISRFKSYKTGNRIVCRNKSNTTCFVLVAIKEPCQSYWLINCLFIDKFLFRFFSFDQSLRQFYLFIFVTTKINFLWIKIRLDREQPVTYWKKLNQWKTWKDPDSFRLRASAIKLGKKELNYFAADIWQRKGS